MMQAWEAVEKVADVVRNLVSSLDMATALTIEVAVEEAGGQKVADTCGLRWQWTVRDSAFLYVKAVVIGECSETKICYAGSTALEGRHVGEGEGELEGTYTRSWWWHWSWCHHHCCCAGCCQCCLPSVVLPVTVLVALELPVLPLMLLMSTLLLRVRLLMVLAPKWTPPGPDCYCIHETWDDADCQGEGAPVIIDQNGGD
jgi:predicted secreted protein